MVQGQRGREEVSLSRFGDRRSGPLRLQILIALESVHTRLFFIDAQRGRQPLAQS